MHRLSTLILAALAVVNSAPAVGCRADPEDSDTSGFDNAVLARITSVEPTPVTQPWMVEYAKYNWSAELDVVRPLRGKTKSKHFRVTRTSGPGYCWAYQMPKVGDLWVLYMYYNDLSRVADGYDLILAQRHDRRLREIKVIDPANPK